jgi:hypothetical protein
MPLNVTIIDPILRGERCVRGFGIRKGEAKDCETVLDVVVTIEAFCTQEREEARRVKQQEERKHGNEELRGQESRHYRACDKIIPN